MVAWLALTAVLLAAAAPAEADSPEAVLPGYQDVSLVDAVEAPMSVRFAPPPDGRIFVAEKAGVLLAFDAPRDPEPEVVVDLRSDVHDFWDRGLLGMALDPGFATNRRLYLLYARDAPIGEATPRWGDYCEDATTAGCLVSGRLVRVTLPAIGGSAAIEPVIEHEWCQQYPSHSVGSLQFGPDGMLYASAGEGAMWNAGNPDWGQQGDPDLRCDDPRGEGGALRAQDVRTTTDPTGLSGAILRIDPLTGEPPPDNPLGGDRNRRRVIAYGMRNPFRFAFRPGTEEIWLGDVGQSRWEEINRIDAGDATAENLGWPCYEGAQPLAGWGSRPLCSSLGAGAVTAPRFAYEHDTELTPGDGCAADTGSSLSGIAFAGDGTMFFSDYARNCIWVVDPSLDFATARVLARGPAGTGPVNLEMAPNGDLVYAYYDPYDEDNSEIRRIRSSAANAAPVASLVADRAYGHAPLHVEFSAAGSTDADGDELTFAWDLDGDGAYDDGAGSEASRSYDAPVTVRLRVRDPFGEQDLAQVLVSPGNTPPSVAIDAPGPWAVGDTIDLRGTAADAEGDEVELVWTLALEHCELGGGCHAHPMQQLTGAEAAFTAPDHEYPSHVAVRLEGTDSGGLSADATRVLHPRTVDVAVRSEPLGLAVAASAGTVLEGSSVVLSTERVQGEYRFVRWSDGSTEPVRSVRVGASGEFVAYFERVPPPDPPADTPPPAGDPPRDRSAPRLRVLAARLRAGRLRVRAVCPDEPCRLEVRARGRAAVRRLAAGRPVTATLRVRARRITVRVTAADAAGNRTVRRRVARL